MPEDELLDTAGEESGTTEAPESGEESGSIESPVSPESGQQEGQSAAAPAPAQPDYLTREAFNETFGQVSQQYQRQFDQMQQNMQQMQQALYRMMTQRQQSPQNQRPAQSLIPDPQSLSEMSAEGFHGFLTKLNESWEQKVARIQDDYRRRIGAIERARREEHQSNQYLEHYNTGISKAQEVYKELKDPNWLDQFKLALIARTNLARGDLNKVDIMGEAKRIANLARIAKRAGPQAEAQALAQQNNASAAAGAPTAPLKGASTRPGQKKMDFTKLKSMDDLDSEEWNRMHEQLLQGWASEELG